MRTEPENFPVQGLYPVHGSHGAFFVELTPLGFRIRHGRYGEYGLGVWSEFEKAIRAADHLANDGRIPPRFQADRLIGSATSGTDATAPTKRTRN